MEKKEKIVLVGGGGHCKVIIDAIFCGNQYEIEGIVDNNLTVGTKVLSVPVLGSDEMLLRLFRRGIKKAFITVGSTGDCSVRKRIFSMLNDVGFTLPIIVHPKAVVAFETKIGAGTFIAASATINPGTVIGCNAIINTSCSIDHDCDIGDFVHIAPGAVLSGAVIVGADTHIAAGISVRQGIKIGSGCMVKMGSVVIHDLSDGMSYSRGSLHGEDKKSKREY